MDEDLQSFTRDQLLAEVKRLRSGIREHRDSSGHELCWHHPQLWALLPDQTDPLPAVPDWPQFLRGCIRYRQSLDEQLPHAPRVAEEAGEGPATPRGHYLLFYEVAADYPERRAPLRDVHLDHAWRAHERGELILAGALADPIDGAVLLFQGPSAQVATDFAEADPYVTNGLITRWYVRPWTTVVGREPASPVGVR